MRPYVRAGLLGLNAAAVALCAWGALSLAAAGPGPLLDGAVVLERGTCALGALWWGQVFAAARRRLPRPWARLGCAAGCGALFTGAVFLWNNYLSYLVWNARLGWVDPLPYRQFLARDAVYAVGLGALRYPAVFLLMVLACWLIGRAQPVLAEARAWAERLVWGEETE